MRPFLFAFFLLAVLAPAAPFQNPASMPWWTSSVVTDLGLSEQQQHRVRAIVRSYRDRLFDARNNAQKAEAEVRDLMNERTVNPAAARPAIERLAHARAESTRLFTQMSVDLRTVLTFEQWRELIRRWSEVQKTRKGRDTELAP